MKTSGASGGTESSRIISLTLLVLNLFVLIALTITTSVLGTYVWPKVISVGKDLGGEFLISHNAFFLIRPGNLQLIMLFLAAVLIAKEVVVRRRAIKLAANAAVAAGCLTYMGLYLCISFALLYSPVLELAARAK